MLTVQNNTLKIKNSNDSFSSFFQWRDYTFAQIIAMRLFTVMESPEDKEILAGLKGRCSLQRIIHCYLESEPSGPLVTYFTVSMEEEQLGNILMKDNKNKTLYIFLRLVVLNKSYKEGGHPRYRIGLTIRDLTNMIGRIQDRLRRNYTQTMQNTLSHEHLTPLNQIINMTKLLAVHLDPNSAHAPNDASLMQQSKNGKLSSRTHNAMDRES